MIRLFDFMILLSAVTVHKRSSDPPFRRTALVLKVLTPIDKMFICNDCRHCEHH